MGPYVVLLIVTAMSGAAAQAANSAGAPPRSPAASVDPACTLKPSDLAQVQWSAVSIACANPADTAFCRNCICGIGNNLVTGLYAAGVQLDASPEVLDNLLNTCTATVGNQLVASAGFNSDTLQALAQCPVSEIASACATTLAEQQGTRAAAVASAAAGVNVTAGAGSAPANAAAVSGAGALLVSAGWAAALLVGAALMA